MKDAIPPAPGRGGHRRPTAGAVATTALLAAALAVASTATASDEATGTAPADRAPAETRGAGGGASSNVE